jgi:hypothetical protein
MKSTRRGFIKILAVGILGNGLMPSLPAVFAKTNAEEDGIEIQKGFKIFDQEAQKNMEALAETLVPGAKEIGIRRIFMDYVSANPGQGAFFDAGLWNLDTLSRSRFKKPFYQLEKKEDKKTVIEHITRTNKAFFTKFRETIIRLYYSNPAVWKRLSYNGPPQPVGFMDYWLSPKKTEK